MPDAQRRSVRGTWGVSLVWHNREPVILLDLPREGAAGIGLTVIQAARLARTLDELVAAAARVTARRAARPG